jgi:hypothetical protein
MLIKHAFVASTVDPKDRMIQVSHLGNEATVIVAPGRYWIGDPIAVFPEMKEWTVPIQRIDDKQVLGFETVGMKTGIFYDGNGISYVSKSGILGLVPASLLDCHRMEAMDESYEGSMITFPHSVVCLSNEAGTIRFGSNVTIDTRNAA